MASYSQYSDTAMEAIPCPDGNSWQRSANMQRSTSNSTSRTVDSSYTASSYSSGYYSVKLSSTGLPTVEDDTPFDSPAGPYPPQYPEPNDADYLLSATGSQYQLAGGQLPQALQICTPLQLFDSSIGNIDEAADRASRNASSQIARERAYGKREPSVIHSQAVESARQTLRERGEESTYRAGVQKVIKETLYRHFNHDMDHNPRSSPSTILDEAAYLLQVRLQGPEAYDICFYAIGMALQQLRARLATECHGASSNPQTGGSFDAEPASARLTTPTTSTTAEREKYLCRYPGCNKGASRQADLERHYRIVHLDEDERTKYLCDYRRCGRHSAPFFRQDHFRDHLRIYHKEDLLRRGNRGDREWWDSRAPRALHGGWWRCSRCLVRVDQAAHGFVCPGCGNPCESERQRYRLNAKV